MEIWLRTNEPLVRLTGEKVQFQSVVQLHSSRVVTTLPTHSAKRRINMGRMTNSIMCGAIIAFQMKKNPEKMAEVVSHVPQVGEDHVEPIISNDEDEDVDGAAGGGPGAGAKFMEVKAELLELYLYKLKIKGLE